MESVKKVILVLWDFTEGAENALLHALQLAKVAGNDIMLLNIIPIPWHRALFKRQPVTRPQFNEAKRNLERCAAEISEKHGVNPTALVIEGHPHSIIKELVNSANINLIIANRSFQSANATYESYAFLKNFTLKDYAVPFILVDNPPVHSHYIEIVIPLDHDKKYKEVLHWIIYLSKYYKCNVNLIKPFIVDEGKKKKMANNIYFSKKMLDGNQVVYGVKTAKRKQPFNEEVFKFAHNIDSDLILIMADKYEYYLSGLGKKERLKIPIMCIAPRVRKFQGFN